MINFTSIDCKYNFSLDESEIELTAIRAQGSGGQNVNKLSSAIHLRFDIRASSLPDAVKERMLCLNDQRISKDGVLVIKAQTHRTQSSNRQDALDRLAEIISSATVYRKTRRPTKVSKAARKKRLDSKVIRGKTKSLRRKPTD